MKRVKIHASIVDDITEQQVKQLANSEAYKNAIIRVMPDCHAGKGCTIGSVIQYTDKVVPNTVGVDIGCGWMEGKKAEWEQIPDDYAQFLGTVEAKSFIDACKIALDNGWSSADPDESWTDYFHVDKDGIPYFAKCRLWDNEENARKRNG